MTGTHRGALFGLPPTGRAVKVAQMTIERFRDGKIIAHHRVTDDLAMMRQLGLA
jgi:predicted ester cyclase